MKCRKCSKQIEKTAQYYDLCRLCGIEYDLEYREYRTIISFMSNKNNIIEQLKRKNKRLNKIIVDIEDWATVGFDESLLKLIKALKAGRGRK